MSLDALMDANIARLGEGLRVIEDVFRFTCVDDAIVRECKALRNQLKHAVIPGHRMDRLTARNTQTDGRARSEVPKRTSVLDLLTANIKRATEACRCLEEATSDPCFTNMRYDIYELETRIHVALQRDIFKTPGLYVISDDADHLIQMAQHPGVSLVQYRAKGHEKSAIYSTCQRIATALANVDNIRWIVNDHADIAVAVGAHGVHLGQDDLPTPVVRQQIGPLRLIGRTTHTLEQGWVARDEGADYVSVGPIWDTPSKPDRPGIGLSYLTQAHQLGIPFVAIGGIDVTTLPHILPMSPPLIGIIRATTDIDAIWAQYHSHTSPNVT